MCEFRVYLESRERIGWRWPGTLSWPRKKDGNILLVNGLGAVTLVNDASIEEADISARR